jgi:hypothetical protein
MGNILKVLLFIGAVYYLWTVLKPDKYIGFYYPDAGDLLTHIQSHELESLEECREWVDDVSDGRTDDGFDYECGMNCKLSQTGGIYICEETLE